MMMLRPAAALLPKSCSLSTFTATSNSVARLLPSNTNSYSSGRTAGEMGDDAAQSMRGAEGTAAAAGSKVEPKGRSAGDMGEDAAKSMRGAESSAAHAGDRVEPKVSQGFVPEADAVLSPDTAGRAGGIGADVMGDMVDMVASAVKGDNKKAAADVMDMARQGSDAHTSTHAKAPHTTTQDWPRGSITDPAAYPASSRPEAGAGSIGEAPFVNTDESSPAGIDRYEGTIPRTDPREELPEVDQDPPESAAAGPTPVYSARGGDTRAI